MIPGDPVGGRPVTGFESRPSATHSVLEWAINMTRDLWIGTPTPMTERTVVDMGLVNKIAKKMVPFTESLKDDKNFVLALVSKNGTMLEHASERLKNDLNVAQAAVKKDPRAFRHVGDSAKDNKELALLAVSKCWTMLEHASERLKNDLDFVQAVVEKDPRAFRHVGDSAKDNKEITLLAVSKDGWILHCASERLKNDLDVAQAAVKKDLRAFRHVGDSAKDNKELALLAVSKCWTMLEHASERLKNDLDVAQAAVKKDPEAFEYAGDTAKDNKELALLAISKDASMFQYASERLKNDRDFVQAAIEKDPRAFEYAGIECKLDNLVLDSFFSKVKVSLRQFESYMGGINIYTVHRIFAERTAPALKGTPLLEKVLQYRNHAIRSYFINLLKKEGGTELNDTVERLSKDRSYALLPIALISRIVKTTPVFPGVVDSFLKNNRHLLKDKSSNAMQTLLDLLVGLDRSSLPQEKKQAILLGIFSASDFVSVCRLVNVGLTSGRFAKELPDSFSFKVLAEFILRDFTKTVMREVLVDAFDEKMTATFLASTMPTGLFTYANLFKDDAQMLDAIREFTISVLEGTFEKKRNEANSHKAYLTPEQKAEWEKGCKLHPIAASAEKEVSFDPRAFLLQTLKDDRHGGTLFDGVIAEIEGRSAAASMALSELEKIIVELSSERDEKKMVDILTEIETLMKEKPYASLQFYRDVQDQIVKLTKKGPAITELYIEDTADWDALFTCGSAVLGSCQTLDGDPDLNKGLLGYVLDGKTRMIAVRKEGGELLSRAIIKILLNAENRPGVFLERTYTNRSKGHDVEILDFAKERAKALGMPLYTAGREIPLHSEGCAAPWEYEDVGIGPIAGKYTIDAEKVL